MSLRSEVVEGSFALSGTEYVLPTRADAVAGDFSDLFNSSISSHARRYDMLRLRAAAEIEPCSLTASSNATLPGPSAIVSACWMRMRNLTSGFTVVEVFIVVCRGGAALF